MMKTYLSAKIQQNRTDPSTMQQQEQVDAVLEQVNEQQQGKNLKLELIVARNSKYSSS